MTPSEAPRLGVLALSASLSAIAFLFRENLLGVTAFALGLFQLLCRPPTATQLPKGNAVVQLLGLSWTLEEFLTHWVVVGRSGAGKTSGVIRTILIQLIHTVPDFGCIAIDEKANFHKVLAKICTACGRADKLIVLRPRRPGRDQDQPIAHTMNFIGDRTISWETYAQLVIDTAVACGQETNNAFFKNQGRKTITAIFATLDAVHIVPTLGEAYDFIAEDRIYKSVLQKLRRQASSSERSEDLVSFWDSFDSKAGEERSGIKSTTELYLHPYSAPELREMFADPEPSLQLSVIDQGKILCPSIPQAFLTQRRYITAWFKLAGYYHLLRRFDEFDEAEREKLTPVVLLADEGHNSLLVAEEGLAEHNSLDKIREARGTLLLSMQSYSSALTALKGRRDLAETIFTNLNNHVIGAIRDETGREMASNIFGKEWQDDRSKSYGGSGPSTSVRKELRHIFHTGIFARLPPFKCVVFHVAGRWAQG